MRLHHDQRGLVDDVKTREIVMSEITSVTTEQQTPQAQLAQMAIAHWYSSLVYVAAETSLADRLAEAPRTAAELAQSMGCDAPSLYRFMRTLAGLGLFTEDVGHRFSVMTPKSRLLIIEMVLPTGNTPHLGKMFDMVMLTVPGGRERTEPEYCELLEKAGFRFTQVVPTASAVGIVEALPA